MLLTGLSVAESEKSLALANSLSCEELYLYSTVGVHPTYSNEYTDDFKNDTDDINTKLSELIERGSTDGKVLAVGEAVFILYVP